MLQLKVTFLKLLEMTRTLNYQNASEWLLLQGFVTVAPNENGLIYFFIDVFQKVLEKFPRGNFPLIKLPLKNCPSENSHPEKF